MASRFELSHPDVAHLLRWVQDGVVTRTQLLDHGATPADLRRLLRQRRLARVLPGVFVDHTGPLTQRQREWGAVLAAWPAALTRESALPVSPPDTVHVAVALGRTLKLPNWIRVHRSAEFEQRANLNSRPPAVDTEHALVDAMSARVKAGDTPGAFALLAQTVHSRRTTPDRILAVLAARRRITNRWVLEGLIEDLRDGACSVLEREYLREVERKHGLPRGHRQHPSRATGRRTDKDVQYLEYEVIVELDGRAYHGSPRARDRDARRDLAELATNNAVTVRVTYGLVFHETCRTAAWIATVLQRNGWQGSLRRCPDCPAP